MSIIAKRRTVGEAGLQWQPTEEQEQAAVMEWAMLMEKQAPELALLYHCPNGADRHPAVAAKLKKQVRARLIELGREDLMDED